MAPFEDTLLAENPDFWAAPSGVAPSVPTNPLDFELSGDLMASFSELFGASVLSGDSLFQSDLLLPGVVPSAPQQQLPSQSQLASLLPASAAAAAAASAFWDAPLFSTPGFSPAPAWCGAPAPATMPLSSFAIAPRQPAHPSLASSLLPHHSLASDLPALPNLLSSADLLARCAQCDTLPGKRVSFKPTPASVPETLTLKDFYGRICSDDDLRRSLTIPAHPTFESHDAAVGYFYILKDVRARKPPQIGSPKFNCHTRRDAGDSHWQYNAPGTDFTCRVTQWQALDETGRTATYTSYHYYRSPTRRPSVAAGRWSPY